MMPLYEYECASCGIFEEFRNIDEREKSIACPDCGKRAYYRISAPRIKLDGCDPSFPGAYQKWAKKREAKMKVERQKMADHNTYT
jgi:putative FmdB family regulatory protein